MNTVEIQNLAWAMAVVLLLPGGELHAFLKILFCSKWSKIVLVSRQF
jgi:hypothetical protein